MNDYLKSNEAFKIALETLKSELDYNTSIIEAKEEGIEEGLEKGLQQGIKKGLQEGIAQNQKEVVLNLHQMGMEIELIAKAVNLTIDEVNKIIEK